MSVSLVNSNYDTSYISQVLGLSGTSSTSSTSTTSSDDDSDSVSISSSGSASSELVSLIQERQSIMASRAELVSTTSENGGSTDDIQDQLDEYDSQLEDLNAQITQLKAQASQEQTQNVVTYSKNSIKTGNSSQVNRMNNLVGLSANLSTARTAASVMNRFDRQSNSLEGEIAADESRGLDTSDKEDELDALQEKAYSAASTIAGALNDINQAIIEENGNPLVELDYPTVSSSTLSTSTTTTTEDTADATETTDAAGTTTTESE